MKFYGITDDPIRIYGLAVSDANQKRFWKLQPEIMERMPQYSYLGKRCAGGRVRFCTNSEQLTVRMVLAKADVDICIPLSGSAGADVYLGKGRESFFLGYLAPETYTSQGVTVEKTFIKSKKLELVTINLPRNEHLLGMEIGIENNAVIQRAPDYALEEPIVFYGSSITEGGCAPRAGIAYTSILGRWLDCDYRNMGFSGLACGEEIFARYLTQIPDMSVLVCDYDHNAPDAEHLKATHESFYKTIRKGCPNLPIVMMTKPDIDGDPIDAQNRREVIYQTYEQARKNGDEKLWFVDGQQFFGFSGRAECTIDGVHPNALGFMRMAETLFPLLKHIIEEELDDSEGQS